MAGFFGLFNYEKEGPGIRKDAPKKKTFVVFFETFFRNFWKFVPLNCFYMLLSLPLLTGGLASVGLTHVARNTARDKHSFGFSDYLDTIRKNWKQALLVGILRVISVALLVFAFIFYLQSEGWGATLGIGVCLCIAFVLAVMDFFVWTLIVTFRFTIKQLLKNCFHFVFLNIKLNLLCCAVLLFVNALFIALPFLFFHPLVVTIEAIFYMCAYPTFQHLLVQYCTFPAIKKHIIDPYYEEHPDEDLDRRRDLGLEVEDPNEGQDEDLAEGEEDPDAPVFED